MLLYLQTMCTVSTIGNINFVSGSAVVTENQNLKISLRKKCPYSEVFWSVFSPNVAKYALEYGHFSGCV